MRTLDAPRVPARRSRPIVSLKTASITLAALAALSACGGGGDEGSGISNADAQGYAADAATMPVVAGATLGAAASALQGSVAAAAAQAGSAAAIDTAAAEKGGAAQEAVSPTVTRGCAGGGSVTWVASGPTLALLTNGRLDAGETYDITYNACAVAFTGEVLNGNARVVVNAADTSGFDITTTATALSSTTLSGARYVLDGSVRQQWTSTATAGGGASIAHRVSTQRLALASTIGSRRANYELRDMDWTVTTVLAANATLVSRTHVGSLTFFASTPRRPNATLQVATVGPLVIGADGLAESGGFSLTFSGDKWTVTYAATTVTIALDIGNNGSVERTWTISRPAFHGDAG
jgi:hypothetical protein